MRTSKGLRLWPVSAGRCDRERLWRCLFIRADGPAPPSPIGEVFSYRVRHTWEFTSDHPIRSVFPLYPVYGLPMLLLRWLWIGNGGDGEIPPRAVFWVLRVLMFGMNFVLEDWAIYELMPSIHHRDTAVMLIASSYVTWTYQMHTFSNSVETLAVAWSLVLIKRILERPVSLSSCPLCSADRCIFRNRS